MFYNVVLTFTLAHCLDLYPNPNHNLNLILTRILKPTTNIFIIVIINVFSSKLFQWDWLVVNYNGEVVTVGMGLKIFQKTTHYVLV